MTLIMSRGKKNKINLIFKKLVFHQYFNSLLLKGLVKKYRGGGGGGGPEHLEIWLIKNT